MKSKKITIWILSGFLIFLSGVGTVLYFSGDRVLDDERGQIDNTLYLHTEFPKNVIDGYVLDVDRDNKEIKFLVLTENMIINPPKASEELIVRVDDETIFFLFDFETEEEVEIEFDDIQIWDDLAVGTKEDSLELFERDFFTATEITKRVGEPFADQNWTNE